MTLLVIWLHLFVMKKIDQICFGQQKNYVYRYWHKSRHIFKFLSNFLKFKSVDCFEPQEELCNVVKLNNSNLNIKTHSIALSNTNQIKNFIIIEFRRNLVFINKIILLNL